MGTVTDKVGNVITGANLNLVNTKTGEVRRTVTNSSGSYSLSLLPPTTYRLTVESQGFSQFVQENIDLNVGDDLTINAVLDVGRVAQQVTVTSQPSALQTETSSLGQVISNKTIVDLPVNGRNSYSFAALVPGVLPSGGFTQTAVDEYNDQFISINGSRPNSNVFLIDGGTNTEPGFNGPGFYPSIDMVDQYKVQTNNYSAEFSSTTGGVVNVITRSGTNRFHGSAYEFFRSTGLNGNIFSPTRRVCPEPRFTTTSLADLWGGQYSTKKLSSSSPTKGCVGHKPLQRLERCPLPQSGRAISPQAFLSTIRFLRFKIRQRRGNISERNFRETRYRTLE